MQPYPLAPDLVWPGHLHGTGCLSARAVGTGFPTVGLRLWLGPGCVWWWVLLTPARCAWGLGWVCLGSVCGVVPLLPAVCGVRGCALVSACFRDQCGFVRVSLAPRRFRFRCAVWACVLGPGLGCAPPFLAGLSGCVFCAFFFFFPRLLGVPVPGLVVSHPVSFLSGWAAGFFFLFCLFRCSFSRWAAVPGLVLPVLAGWSPCTCLGVLSSVPSGWGVWPPSVLLAAVWWLWAVFAPPPPFFFGGGGGRLAVPPFAFPRLALALWLVCGVVGPSPLLAEVPVCYSPPLLAGFRCRWWWAVPATPGWGLPAAVVCGGGVLVGLWLVCGVVGPSPLLAEVPVCYSPPLLAGFRCRWWWAVPATPGWGLPAAVVCGGGVLVGLWLVCGVVGPSPLLAEVPVCYSPPLLAGFRCRWWWAVPVTPGWGLLAAVVCGVWCVAVVCWWGCGWCVVWLVPRNSWRMVPVCYSPPLLAGFRCRWWWAVPTLLAGVCRWRWCVAVVCWWGCGWCVVWLVPRHSWRRFLCATPRHSWLGFAAAGGGRSPPLLAGVCLRRWCVVCGVWRWCVGGVVAGVWCGWSLATPGGGSCVLLPATPGWVSLPVVVGGPRHSWLGSACGGGVWCVVCGVWCVALVCWWGCSGVWCGWSLATPGGGSCVLLPATPGWVSLPLVVGGPRHFWLGSACGGGVWCVVCGGGVLVGLWLVCGVVGPSPLLAEVPVCYSPPLLAGFRCRWWWAVPATPGWGPLAASVCGVWRWCVVGVVVGVWCGWSLATPGGGPCVLLPATPGWVSLPVVVGGPRHSWLGSAGGGGVWCVVWCVVCCWGSSPLLAEVPVCYSPPLVAGFRCRWWWAVPATPGWGPLAAVVCVLCLAGSGGPASRARSGAPHLFLWPLCLFALLGPLRAGVAPLSFAAVAVPRWLFFSASRCLARASFVSPAWPLAALWWLLPPPPPLCLAVFVAPACGLCGFFFSPLLLPPCAPGCLRLSLVSGPGCPGPRRLRCLFCWPSASRLSVRLSLFRAFRLVVGCSRVVAAPPPPFVSRGFRSCRSVLCAVLCCASLGAVLRRAAACCVARCCAVVCCVALVWCRCLLRRALWRCPLPWGPVLCGAVFCGFPPRCVLCAVCVLSWRGGACCCSPLCLVLCVSRGAVLCVPCALRSVRCCASLCWCARVVLFVWCVLLLASVAVVRYCVLCCFLWCAVVRCRVWWPVVVCWWRVSVSVSLSGRVVCFPVVGVVCCGALLSCVVFCGAVLSRGAVLLCSAVVLRCCWGLLCPPVGRRAVLCCAVGWLCCFWPGGGVCVLWCSFPRAVRSLSFSLCALRCLVVLAVVPCFPVSCAVALCCRVVLCCRALLSFCGAVCVCCALLRPVVRRQCGLRCCWCLVLWRVPVRCGVSLGVLRCGGAALVCRGVLLCCALSCGVLRSVPCPAVPCCPAVLCWLAVLCGCLRCWYLFCPLFFCLKPLPFFRAFQNLIFFFLLKIK